MTDKELKQHTDRAKALYLRGLRAGLMVALIATASMAVVFYYEHRLLVDEAKATNYYHNQTETCEMKLNIVRSREIKL